MFIDMNAKDETLLFRLVKANVIIDEKYFALLSDLKKRFVTELKITDFNPNLSQMSKNLGASVSTVHRMWNWLKSHFDIQITLKFTKK